MARKVLRWLSVVALFSALGLSMFATVFETYQVEYRAQGVLTTAADEPIQYAEVLLLLEQPDRLGKDGLMRLLLLQRMHWQSDPTVRPALEKLANSITPGISGSAGYFQVRGERRYETQRSWLATLLGNPSVPFQRAWLVLFSEGRVLPPIALDISRWQPAPTVNDLRQIIVPLIVKGQDND